MRIDIMTLFPEFVDTVLAESIIGRARKKGILDIRTWQIRDYSSDKHRRVDDTPYGGGHGGHKPRAGREGGTGSRA